MKIRVKMLWYIFTCNTAVKDGHMCLHHDRVTGARLLLNEQSAGGSIFTVHKIDRALSVFFEKWEKNTWYLTVGFGCSRKTARRDCSLSHLCTDLHSEGPGRLAYNCTVTNHSGAILSVLLVWSTSSVAPGPRKNNGIFHSVPTCTFVHVLQILVWITCHWLCVCNIRYLLHFPRSSYEDLIDFEAQSIMAFRNRDRAESISGLESSNASSVPLPNVSVNKNIKHPEKWTLPHECNMEIREMFGVSCFASVRAFSAIVCIPAVSSSAYVRSDRAFFERILRITACGLSRHIHIGPAIPTSSSLGADWVYWPSGSDFRQAQRRSPSQATHVSQLDGVLYLLLHRHKIQRTTVYCPRFDGWL
jgi:hypothetical protein